MGKYKISFLNRIIKKFHYGLILQVIRNRLARIGIEITPYYWMMADTNKAKEPQIKGIISEYSVEFLDENDITSMVKNTVGYTEHGLLSELRNGNKCLGLKHHNDIVSFIWIHFNKCDFEPINIPLGKDEVYLTHMYTMEKFRGKNIAPYLRWRCCEYLIKMGYDKIYSVVEYFNTSALNYVQKTNPKILKLVLFMKLFKRLKRSFLLKSF